MPDETPSEHQAPLSPFRRRRGTNWLFVGLLYTARQRTRQGQGRQGVEGLAHKMAYFFTVLRGLMVQPEH